MSHSAPRPAPQTVAQRVRASERKAAQAGAQRLPGGMLPPDAAQALEQLLASGYAPSKMQCIAAALMAVAARQARRP